MKILFTGIFILFVQWGFAQFHGGNGDGYASAALHFTSTHVDMHIESVLYAHCINNQCFIQNLQDQFFEVKLIDLQGRILFSKVLQAGQTLSENVESGMYIFSIQHERTAWTQKLVVP